MAGLRIVFGSVLAAIVYGILHDLVTAHVCLQYFTVAHPLILPSGDPVVMALLWGVLATWWVGLALGVPLAVAARFGGRPELSLSDVLPNILSILKATACMALVLGLIGYFLSQMHWIWLLPPMSEKIPRESWDGFFFDAFAHVGSYLAGLVGGVFLIAKTWKRRSHPLVCKELCPR